MAEVRITEITLPRGEADRENGVIARFAFDLAPIRVRGCALVRGIDGEPLAKLPRCRAGHAEIRFTDHETRMQVTRAALAAYRALGGVLPAP